MKFHIMLLVSLQKTDRKEQMKKSRKQRKFEKFINPRNDAVFIFMDKRYHIAGHHGICALTPHGTEYIHPKVKESIKIAFFAGKLKFINFKGFNHGSWVRKKKHNKTNQ